MSGNPLSTGNGGVSAEEPVTPNSLSTRYLLLITKEANARPDTGRLVSNPPTPSFRLETVVGVGGCGRGLFWYRRIYT